jgi:hypothetical protein
MQEVSALTIGTMPRTCARMWARRTREPRAALRAVFLMLACLSVLAGTAFGQAAQGRPPAGQGQAIQAKDRVRVPTSGANVHMAPSSGAELLVVLAKGTVLDVLARDGEWLQVQLTPDMRKTGLVFRWYKNEDRGWMHDSTVEVVK